MLGGGVVEINARHSQESVASRNDTISKIYRSSFIVGGVSAARFRWRQDRTRIRSFAFFWSPPQGYMAAIVED